MTGFAVSGMMASVVEQEVEFVEDGVVLIGFERLVEDGQALDAVEAEVPDLAGLVAIGIEVLVPASVVSATGSTVRVFWPPPWER